MILIEALSVRMLYEFHCSQNARKPGCVHATYLIGGVPKPQEAHQDQKPNGVNSQQDEDIVMNDNSIMSSSLPDPVTEEQYMSEKIPVISVALVQEQHLEGEYNSATMLNIRRFGLLNAN